eukprot:gnl/TRDRNA2_/TRDRNA2_144230_c0_seq1.p1 gnl/TRDRNA2_/TRDRNA2_144230_c0~~gnl/TRDRNA2_/TRDRNA2_144230_c0_seq1.p1  ORF type:complete len:184 (+),score=11.59 gnl/TRDRNA2_/TRDRNA2_144230_c0_seq1:161-712(+)
MEKASTLLDCEAVALPRRSPRLAAKALLAGGSSATCIGSAEIGKQSESASSKPEGRVESREVATGKRRSPGKNTSGSVPAPKKPRLEGTVIRSVSGDAICRLSASERASWSVRRLKFRVAKHAPEHTSVELLDGCRKLEEGDMLRDVSSDLTAVFQKNAMLIRTCRMSEDFYAAQMSQQRRRR